MEDVLSSIEAFHKKPLVAVVCEECHADGTPHLHVYVEFKDKLEFRNCKYFDSMWPGYHCNIGTVRSPTRALAYIIKDGTYVLFGTTELAIEILLSGTFYKLADVCAALTENPNIREVALQFPSIYVRHHQGLTKYAEHVRQDRKARKVIKGTLEPASLLDTQNYHPEIQKLNDWITANLVSLQENLIKQRKTRQLFIHGPTNHGKTYLLDWFRSHYRCYIVPPTENFYDSYTDEDYDVCIFDEFWGKKKQITWMNAWAEGVPMCLPKKGSQYEKLTNHPFLVASNLPPYQCYPGIYANSNLIFDAFLNRFTVVDLTDCNTFQLVKDLEERFTPAPIPNN